MKNKKYFYVIGCILFFLILFIGSVVGFLLPLRPEVSEFEKRTLSKFPEISQETFLNGTFFSDVSLWYADTYPAREKMIQTDQKLKSYYGIEMEEKMVGGNIKADEIPDSTLQEELEELYELETESVSEIASEGRIEEGCESENGEKKAAKQKKQGVKKENPPDSEAMEKAVQNRIREGMYVKNDAAYHMYYFVKEAAFTYVKTLNRLARELKGISNVYSILIPENSGVMLPESELKKLGGSDQRQAISYYYSLLKDVHTVETYDTLREHNKEYLYFRTDHHWTQRGAYYVYQNFCKEKGITPHKLSDFEKKKYNNFLGTSYQTLKSGKMKANPDYVEAYVPMGTNNMKIYTSEGKLMDWYVIADVADANPGSKYMCFIGGDQPLSVIRNPKIKDGSSCLILKESYGNCFVPFLVDHYQEVYIVDFRYSDLNLLEYVKRKKIQDVILLNDISIVGVPSIAKTIQELFQ